MRKPMGMGVIIIAISIFLGMKLPHHILLGDICGSGIQGLRVTAMYYIVMGFIVLALFLLYKKGTRRIHCKACYFLLDKSMIICPFCGSEIEGDEYRT